MDGVPTIPTAQGHLNNESCHESLFPLLGLPRTSLFAEAYSRRHDQNQYQHNDEDEDKNDG